MHVITNSLKVTITAAVHDQRLVATAEQMTEELVTPIKATGVNAKKPLHACDQVWLGRFNKQVKMIGHQAIPMNLPEGFVASFSQAIQKLFPVQIITEDWLATIAAIH